MSLTHQLFLQTLRQMAEQPQDVVKAYQDRLLERLLIHIYENIPSQQKRIETLIEGDRLNLERWTDLPLQTPQEWQAPDHEAQNLPEEAAQLIEGETDLALVAADTLFEHHLEKQGISLAQRLLDMSPYTTALENQISWNSTIPESRRSEIIDPDEIKTAGQQKSYALIRGDDKAMRPFLQSSTLPITSNGHIFMRCVKPNANERWPQTQRLWAPLNGHVAFIETQPNHFAFEPATHRVDIVKTNGQQADTNEQGEIVLTNMYAYKKPIARVRTGVQGQWISASTLMIT